MQFLFILRGGGQLAPTHQAGYRTFPVAAMCSLQHFGFVLPSEAVALDDFM